MRTSVLIAIVCAALGLLPAASANIECYPTHCHPGGILLAAGSTCFDIVFDPNDVNCELTLVCVMAHADVHDVVRCNDYTDRANSDWYESDCSLDSGVSAAAEASGHDYGHYAAWARAEAAICSPTGPEAATYACCTVTPLPCGWDAAWPSGTAGGLASCSYNFQASPVLRRDGTRSEGELWSATLTGQTTDPVWGEGAPPRLGRCVAWLSDGATAPAIASLMYAGDHRKSENMTYDPNDPISENGAWNYSMIISGGEGEYALTTTQFQFDDAAYDVTGYLGQDSEGRFNAADVAALNTLIGTSDPNDIVRWDIDGDASIGAADVAFVQDLVDLGLDSGVFGDLDADGLPDCGNRRIINDMFDYVLGDAGYHVQLDYDLDGDNDVDDQTVFMTQTCPWPLGDMNCDGSVGMGDINPFVLYVSNFSTWQATYPGCAARNGDVNCDGTYPSMGDINPLVSCIAQGGCDCP